jgi:hypothetical protein
MEISVVTVNPADEPFTLADARHTLELACAQLGIVSDDAELLRLGENALFHLLNDKIVVRIARNPSILPDSVPHHAPWHQFGPSVVAVAEAENAVIRDRPERTLAIGERLQPLAGKYPGTASTWPPRTSPCASTPKPSMSSRTCAAPARNGSPCSATPPASSPASSTSAGP